MIGKRFFSLDEESQNFLFPNSLKTAGYYFLATGWSHRFGDSYTIRSESRREWLPATVPNSPAGESQEFLLATPEPGSSLNPPTITLGDMKRLVAEVTAELDSGDGSQAYKDCIRSKYVAARVNRWRSDQGRSQYYEPKFNGVFLSGQSAGVVLFEFGLGGANPAEKKARLWLDGEDAALFDTKTGELQPWSDNDGDGEFDSFVFDLSVVSARPIPSGSYKFNNNFLPLGYLDCGHTFTYEVPVNVTSPAGTLHEFFFDPVTVDTTVAADGTNGVLKPAAFTDAKGGSVTIESISYEASTVKVEVTPNAALAGHIVDIIELDGTVSLSLDVTDATVDEANDTLSWTASSAPWEDGDLLMVRIREAPPEPVFESSSYTFDAAEDASFDSEDATEDKPSSGGSTLQDASGQEAVTDAPEALSESPYTPGEPSLGERILLADAIAVVQLEQVIGTYRQVVSGRRASEYMAYLEVTYRVEDTLKGNALPEFIIVEVFVRPNVNTETGPAPISYDTADEARTASQTWYDNNPVFSPTTSVVFLKTLANSEPGFDIARPRNGIHPLYVFLGKAGHGAGYIMPWRGQDTVTIDGTNKVVLPLAGGSGDSRTFYLDSPPGPTIALTDLGTKITAVDNMVDDSIDGYRKCLEAKFVEERSGMPKLPEFSQSVTHEWVSGQPVGTVLNWRDGRSDLDGYMRYELGGNDAELLYWEASDDDSDPGNGYRVELTNNRPLPAGTYDFHYRIQYGYWKPCGHISRTASHLTMRMVRGEGVLHELFFDPVTVGSTVAADGRNGVLKPAAFTDAGGASATFDSISYEPSTVKLEVDPHAALAGHIVDIIGLDGTVSLSLDVIDATVDDANDTLSWSVSSEPWEDGDRLMVRIRASIPTNALPSPSPNPAPTPTWSLPPRLQSEEVNGYGYAPRNVEEQTVRSDLIVRVQHLSTEPSARANPHREREYWPYVHFTFRVIEALWGTPVDEVIVVEY